MVNKMALRYVILGVFPFSTVFTTPLVLHMHLHLHVAITSKTNGRSLGTFQKVLLKDSHYVWRFFLVSTIRPQYILFKDLKSFTFLTTLLFWDVSR